MAAKPLLAAPRRGLSEGGQPGSPRML